MEAFARVSRPGQHCSGSSGFTEPLSDISQRGNPQPASCAIAYPTGLSLDIRGQSDIRLASDRSIPPPRRQWTRTSPRGPCLFRATISSSQAAPKSPRGAGTAPAAHRSREVEPAPVGIARLASGRLASGHSCPCAETDIAAAAAPNTSCPTRAALGVWAGEGERGADAWFIRGKRCVRAPLLQGGSPGTADDEATFVPVVLSRGRARSGRHHLAAPGPHHGSASTAPPR